MASSSIGNLFRRLVGPASRSAAAAALPGAGINLALGALSGNPAAGAAYAAGDFLLNYPLIGLARRIAPGTPGGMATIRTAAGKVIEKGANYLLVNIFLFYLFQMVLLKLHELFQKSY